VSLDLDQVQAFVVAADTRHFGRAAERLHLTQQGVSRRITNLERRLGAALFERRPGGVELSRNGRRFLPHAQQLLATAGVAVTSVHSDSPPIPLRVDVWGPISAPLRALRARYADADGDAPVIELDMRRSSDRALMALRRGEVDAAFVAAASLEADMAGDLDVEVIGTEPLGAAMSVQHPLAGRAALTRDDLVAHGLWWPVHEVPDVGAQVAAFAAVNGISIERDGRALGPEYAIEQVVRHPGRITLHGLRWPSAEVPGARVLPIDDPAPHLAWSLVYRRADTNPGLEWLRQATAPLSGSDPNSRSMRATAVA
jgi:DNA-binding transcriptional LysR family regulator